MIKNKEYYLGQIYKLVDLFSLNLAFFIGLFLRFWGDPAFQFSESNYLSLLLFINLTWLFIATNQKVYQRQHFSSRNRYILRVFFVVLVQFVVTIAFNGLIKTFYSRIFLFYTYLNFSVFLIIGRYFSQKIYRTYLKRKAIKSAIVVVGSAIYQEEIVSFLNEEIDLEYEQVINIKEPQNLEHELSSIKKHTTITELYVPLSRFNEDRLEEISNYCDNNFIRLRIIFDWRKLGARKLEAAKLNQTSIFRVTLTPLDEPYNAFVKRTFDVVFSLFVTLFLLSWLFPIMAIAIKLNSKGPIFFKQKRTGIDNKEFYCYKFRSMRTNVLADVKQATQNDPRITKVGAFIRKTSIDELPQFINVLKGEMSIVGPRPHMLKHTEEYSKIVGNFMNRHAIKPGITGLAQIRGFRGEIDDLSLLQNRVRLDRFYVNNWTIFFDLKIVLLTVLTVFKDHK